MRLQGFKPGEKANLYLYKGGEIIGWQALTIGEDGTLTIYFTKAQKSVVASAVGARSGEVLMAGGASPTCGAAAGKQLPARLRAGMMARIIKKMKAILMEAPGEGPLDQMESGLKLTIVSGPVCYSASVWYEVKTKDGQAGWVQESREGKYVLEPVE